jgi:serine/threonine-protein kinase
MAIHKAIAEKPGADETFLRAIAFAEQAEKTAPREADTWGQHADTLMNYGISKSDGRPELRRALEVAERAVTLNPKGWHPLLNRGMTASQLAQAEARAGVDPRPMLARATADLEASLALNDYEDTYHQLANALWTLGDTEAKRGQDPRKSYGRAAETMRKTIAIDARNSHVHNDLGSMLVQRAVWELEHGVDPGPTLGEGIATLEAAKRAAVRDPVPPSNLSWAFGVRARYELATGADATGSLDRAVAEGEAAQRLGSGSTGTISTAIALRLRAVAQKRASGSFADALVGARKLMVAGRRGDAADGWTLHPEVALELTVADLPGERAAALSRARSLLDDHLLKKDPNDAEALALDTAARRLSGRAADCATGEASASRALATNATSARAHLERARLAEHCAGLLPAERDTLLARAKASREAALRIEPYIENDPG